VQTIGLYNICSTLGYTYKDKLHILLELMTEHKEKIGEQVIALENMAQRRYDEVKSSTKNFADLIMDTEVPQLMKGFYKSKIIQYENAADFPKVYKTKIPTEYAIYSLQPTAYQAIGFGHKYPECTEKFLTSSLDKAEWDLAYKSGLNIPKEPDEMVSLDTQQENVKALIRPYVQAKRPDLLSKLNLE